MSEREVLTVAQSSRLDRFLCEALPHLSRRHLQSVVADGEVRINGRRCTKKGTRLIAGDQVEVAATLLHCTTLQAEPDLAFTVLFADDHILAIDKPAGVASVAQRPGEHGTAANFVVARAPEAAGLPHGHVESGIVHRLDTATSGVLLSARTHAAYRSMRQLMSQRGVEKIYRAAVEGELAGGGSIVDALAPRAGDRRRMVIAEDGAPNARPAETQFHRITGDGQHTLLEVRIHTGVRHQIRTHLASIGHPIIGDELYDGRPAQRLHLHAQRVRLVHPAEGRVIEVEAPVPPELSQ